MAIEIIHSASIGPLGTGATPKADISIPVEEGDLAILHVNISTGIVAFNEWTQHGPRHYGGSVQYIFYKWLTPEDGNKQHPSDSGVGSSYNIATTVVLRGVDSIDSGSDLDEGSSTSTSAKIPALTTTSPDTYHIAFTGFADKVPSSNTPAGWDRLLAGSAYRSISNVVHVSDFPGPAGAKPQATFTSTGQYTTYRIALTPKYTVPDVTVEATPASLDLSMGHAEVSSLFKAMILSEDPVVYSSSMEKAYAGERQLTANVIHSDENSPHSNDGSFYAVESTGSRRVRYVGKRNVSGDFTISVWMRPNSTNLTNTALWSMASAGWLWNVVFDSNGRPMITHVSQGTYRTVSNIAFTDTSKWYHLVVRYDNSTNELIVNTDGEETYRGIYSVNVGEVTSFQMFIHPAGGNYISEMWQDEFIVYDKVMSDQFVRVLYTGDPNLTVEVAPVALDVDVPAPEVVGGVGVNANAEVIDISVTSPDVYRYTPLLHYYASGKALDEVPYSPRDVWEGPGDAWFTRAGVDSFVRSLSGGSGGYVDIYRGARSIALLSSTAKALPEGIIAKSDFTSVTSNPRPFVFGFIEASDAWVRSAMSGQFVLYNDRKVYARGPFGDIQIIDVAAHMTTLEGLSIENGKLVVHLKGGSFEVHDLEDPPTVSLHFIMGFVREIPGLGNVTNDDRSARTNMYNVRFGNLLTETAAATKHVYHTAEHSAVEIEALDVEVGTRSNANYNVTIIPFWVYAHGHGVHTVKNVNKGTENVTVNVSSPAPVVTGNEVADVNTNAVTLDVSTVVPEVSAVDSVSLAVTVVDIAVTSLDARGGDPNKNMLFETVETMVLAPNGAYATGGEDRYIDAEPAEVNMEVNTPSVSNITDVLIQAVRVGVEIKLVGFYNREDDKWADFVEGTLGNQNAVWHRFDEAGGTEAIDRWVRTGTSYPYSPGYYDGPTPKYASDNTGTYVGEPTFGISALDDRKAVRLDGVDDRIEAGNHNWKIVNHTNIEPPNTYSQELIFRTTDTGVLMWGRSRTSVSAVDSASIVVTDNGLKIVVQDTDSRDRPLAYERNIPVKVNDGKWHQMVWFQEDPFFGLNLEPNYHWTLMVDGEVVMSRSSGYNSEPRYVDMSVIGARPYSQVQETPLGPLGPDNLAVDVMEFIARMDNTFSRDDATRSWRILSGHHIIDAEVADAGTVSVPQGSTAKGNKKKMLVLYGNGERTSATSSWFRENPNASSWSGMTVHDSITYYTPSRGHVPVEQVTTELKTIDGSGYSVYAMSLLESDGTARGLLTPNRDNYYYDDITGYRRYINLEKDLSIDITEFDVIHVLHWPKEGVPLNLVSGTYAGTYTREQHRRDALKGLVNTLRWAVDKGVSLWIADPQQAVDMGIAEGFEEHSAMREGWYRNERLHIRTAELDAQYGPKRASEPREPVQFEPGDSFAPPFPINPEHRILPTENNNMRAITDLEFIRERRIVATAENFNEWATNYVGESVAWGVTADWMNHNEVAAWNVEKRPDGLPIGSRTIMTIGGYGSIGEDDRPGTKFNSPRGVVVSLTPNNIKGTVIAREQDTYMQGDKEVPNPWADYVTTVLVEKGTIVNGRPVGGRIFVETMDNFKPTTMVNGRGATGWYHRRDDDTRVASEEWRKYINGQKSNVVSDWDFDSRRYKETFQWITSGYFVGETRYTQELPTSEITVPDIDVLDWRLPYAGMNDRGLVWMGIKPEEEFGAVRLRVEPAEASVKTEGPIVQAGRNISIAALPAEARVEFRKPQNIPDPDVTVNANPVRVTVNVTGYQRIVSVGVADVSVGLEEMIEVTGTGEDFVVYLRNENITLYLGED